MLEDIAKEKTTVLQYKMRKKMEVCEELLEEDYDEMCKAQFGGMYRGYQEIVHKNPYAKDGSAGFRMYLFDMEKESNTKKALDFNKERGTTKVEEPGKVDYIVTTQNGSKYALYYLDNYDIEIEGVAHKQFMAMHLRSWIYQKNKCEWKCF